MAGEPLSDLLEFAVDLAEKAGEITLRYFQGRFAVETKADDSPATPWPATVRSTTRC